MAAAAAQHPHVIPEMKFHLLIFAVRAWLRPSLSVHPPPLYLTHSIWIPPSRPALDRHGPGRHTPPENEQIGSNIINTSIVNRIFDLVSSSCFWRHHSPSYIWKYLPRIRSFPNALSVLWLLFSGPRKMCSQIASEALFDRGISLIDHNCQMSDCGQSVRWGSRFRH